MTTLILATIAATVFAPQLGPQDFVERDNRSKYVGKLLANWKALESGSGDESAIQDQIVAFHELQAGKPGTAQFFETKNMWANEMLPILLAGVSIQKAKFLAELTRPFDEIAASDVAASKGKSTKPVGWEWQQANMLAEGRSDRIGNAYEISDRLIKKIQVNINADNNATADFFGRKRPLKEILRECRLHRQAIEAINGPATPGPADGVPESVIDPESKLQMDEIKSRLGKRIRAKSPREPELVKLNLNRDLALALNKIPDRPSLLQADEQNITIFEVSGDKLVAKAMRGDEQAGELGIACWQRLTTLFPEKYRERIVQFNIQSGRRTAGFFAGSGKNDVGKKGYSLSIARFTAAEQPNVDVPDRPVTPRRGTLDWTTVHEMGHYICLTTNAIELFSQAFDGNDKPQPKRRKRPDDYPEDGSPVLDGNFVTSYAERTPGDEETCETFTTYLLIEKLPDNDSLVAKKIRFFETLPGYPELRAHIQKLAPIRESR